MDRKTKIYAIKTFAYLYLLCVLLWKYAQTQDVFYLIALFIGIVLYMITIYVTIIRPMEKERKKAKEGKRS